MLRSNAPNGVEVYDLPAFLRSVLRTQQAPARLL
jgi:hypothetical protein